VLTGLRQGSHRLRASDMCAPSSGCGDHRPL